MNLVCSIIVILLTGQLFLNTCVNAANYDEEIEFVDLEKNYQKQYAECCESGKKQATTKGYCSGSNQITECKSLSELCCLEQLSLRECQAGVKFVTRTRSKNIGRTEDIDCIRLNSYRESFEYRCCSACRMGFMAADSRLGGKRQWCSSEWIQTAVQNLSTFSSLVSTHIETAYVQCCNHGMTLNADHLQSDGKRTDRQVGHHLVSSSAANSNTTCKNGYEFSKRAGGQCVDIDECATASKNDCHEKNLFCVNSPGSYSCSRCKSGFSFDEQLAVCRDVNECDQQPYPCKAGQSCRNLVGSFRCSCQVGYEMDRGGYCVDVNECQLGTHNCHESLRCDNTIGSFHCVRVQDCGTGYTINADQDVCEDVDECVLGTHDCLLPGYRCRNTQGSFKCELVGCPQGLALNATSESCVQAGGLCPTGQRYNGTLGRCLSHDPCLSGPCRPSEQCISLPENAESGYECGPLCPPGYHYNATSKSCTDVDECATGQFECGPHQECVNLAGHYDCACLPGFQMDSSRACVDVNECTAEWWLCQHPHKCTNTVGSFSCAECHPGFTYNQLTGQCDDVDECSNTAYSSTCEQVCVNTPGSYQCGCRQGYRLAADGKSCMDVDECELMKSGKYLSLPVSELNTVVDVAKIKACKRACFNTVGSFECKCPSGFRSYRERCYDINECIENTRLCSSVDESICVNTFGGFECQVIQCPPGYNKTMTNKSVQCLYDEKLPSDHETVNKYDYLFYAMYSNQTIQFNRSSIYTFYATRFTTDEFNSYNSKYGAYFDLRLIFSTPQISQHEYFLLTKPRLNEATISLTKPLAGPQTVKLELTIIGYQKFSYYRQKVVFMINVSEYESM